MQHPLDPTKLVAVDVATAGGPCTICQLAIATWRNGYLIDSWQSLTDPYMDIRWKAAKSPEITPPAIACSPGWPVVAMRLHDAISDDLVATFGPRAKDALFGISAHHRLNPPVALFIDAQRAAAKAWPAHAKDTLAAHVARLGLAAPTSPVSSAIATGRLLLAACAALDCTPLDML